MNLHDIEWNLNQDLGPKPVAVLRELQAKLYAMRDDPEVWATTDQDHWTKLSKRIMRRGLWLE